ncbi:hypothetical protein FQ707_01125 [Bacteroidaceae bacterium HV4-6-C5C]|nr:hypothetical protein FQ707_01125 [Bacteroidaceae bacterium HV4-6-C5C]
MKKLRYKYKHEKRKNRYISTFLDMA